MQNTLSKILYTAIGVVIVILIAYLFASRTNAPSRDNVTMYPTGTSTVSVSTSSLMQAAETSSSSVASNGPSISYAGPIFSYYLDIASTTFSQNTPTKMSLFVYNLTDMPQTMHFKNGCQGTYTIGGFDLSQHITCLPDATMFTIASHSVRTIPLEYYPSVYKLPVGSYSLYTGAIGYGGIVTDVTVTP